MTIIPNNIKFVGISPELDTKERKSAKVNAITEIYTLEDFKDSVLPAGGLGLDGPLSATLQAVKDKAGTASALLISTESVALLGNQFTNFIPTTQTTAVNLTINSGNQNSYCGAVIEASNALTITIDASVRNGFNVSIIQMTANQSTIVASGGLTLRNNSSHTKTAGQWATITLYRDYASNLILAGTTAP